MTAPRVLIPCHEKVTVYNDDQSIASRIAFSLCVDRAEERDDIECIRWESEPLVTCEDIQEVEEPITKPTQIVMEF